ncbi:phytoene desaturase family protein [Paenibacillus sp. J5C_2022]|uniref:phytoene desaturase family protein n=1 Tax=Paenibacillus sp. J5C2022 TaxID=2977129 RepID=UPI0021D068B0|nr:phytoene desaturase family protein [Paenibacillus sp. J5C2022]MCU6709992.1 phytoene desaturase family protein [Paenibacillus sp. J5C2022]
MKNVIVIGGGLGGMSAAIRLAADGHRVTLLEKNERLGGKLNIREGSGFTFDTGPSILTMPWVLDQLFASAGRKLSDYMKLIRVEPQWRTFFEDGVTIDVTSDLPAMLRQVRQHSSQDESQLLAYLHYCQRMYEASCKSYYSRSLSGLSELRSLHTLKELMAMDPIRSMSQGTGRYMKDKHLRQLFDFFSMYVGSSPYAAPAVLTQLVYVQLGLGIYYVEGGMYNIARGMLKLMKELEVEVRTGCKVESLIASDSSASGVRLADGSIVQGDIIVSNLEAIPAYNTLLRSHPRSEDAARNLVKYKPTVSGLVLLLGVDKSYDQLLHHNFFFSEKPEKEFRDIFEEGVPASDPTVYIGVSAKNDPGHAPKGMQNLFVLTHVPPLKEGESWHSRQSGYREIVLDKLERMGLNNLRGHIRYESSFIPDDLQRLYGSNGGSIYGVATDRKLNGGFKIPSRSELLRNLYFVGGSTHPGGGVPMVTLSGQLTADLIKEDWGTGMQSIG